MNDDIRMEEVEMEVSETETETGPEPVKASAKSDKILPASILIAAVMIAGAVVFATLYKGGGGGNQTAGQNTGTQGGGQPAGTLSAASTSAILSIGSRDAVLGSASAPVTVIEYGDYQCPYCAEYYQNLEPQLMQKYISTGKVKMVFRDYPFLGPESDAAAAAAQCAENQNALWAYHDALYRYKLSDYTKGGSENDGVLNRALFMSIASQLHLDATKFASCLDNNTETAVVNQEKADASAVGVRATPTTFVNGVMVADNTGASVGNDSTSIMNAIDAALASAK